jgi:hypothetical protein
MRTKHIRSEQKFWILRRGEPWSVMSVATNQKVMDITRDQAYDIEVEFLLCDTIEEIQSLIQLKGAITQ